MTSNCKHCGADEGLHQWETMRCPKNGVEAPIGRKQEWMSTTFEEYIDIRAMIAAAVAAEREACVKIATSASVRHGLTSAEIRTGDQVAQHIAAAIRARGEGRKE